MKSTFLPNPDESVNNYIRAILQNFKGQMSSGIPDLQIPILDPLRWEPKNIQMKPNYKLVRVEGAKTPAPPPLQPIPLGVQRHPYARLVAHPNTINLTEAIFEFPPQTWDIKLQRVIFGHFQHRGNGSKMTLSPSISLVLNGNSKIASVRLIVLMSAINRTPRWLCTISGVSCRGGAGVFAPSTHSIWARSVLKWIFQHRKSTR